MNSTNKLNNFSVEEFKLLYESMSQKKLAIRLGTSVNNIEKYVKENNFDPKPKGRPRNKDYEFKDQNSQPEQIEALLKRYDEAVK